MTESKKINKKTLELLLTKDIAKKIYQVEGLYIIGKKSVYGRIKGTDTYQKIYPIKESTKWLLCQDTQNQNPEN